MCFIVFLTTYCKKQALSSSHHIIWWNVTSFMEHITFTVKYKLLRYKINASSCVFF